MLLQVAYGKRRFLLINVRNNEVWEIKTLALDTIMATVLKHYHRQQQKESDDHFLEMAKQITTRTIKFTNAVDDNNCDDWFRSTESIIAQQIGLSSPNEETEYFNSDRINTCDLVNDGINDVLVLQQTTKRLLYQEKTQHDVVFIRTTRIRHDDSVLGREAEKAIEIGSSDDEVENKYL